MRRALLFASLALALLAPASAQGAFGLLPGTEGFSVSATEEDGSVDLAAGSHPYEMSIKVALDPSGDEDLRDLHVSMPPGLIENPSAADVCTAERFSTPRTSPFQASLSGEDCPNRSQIGTITVKASGLTRTFGLFNLVPPPGMPSQFGASPFGVPIVLSPHLREEGGVYALTLDLKDLSQLYEFEGFELTLWGTPWATPKVGSIPWTFPHDDERGDCLNEVDPDSPFGTPSTVSGPLSENYSEGTCPSGNPIIFPPHPYLTLSTSCGEPLFFTAMATSWQGGQSEAISNGLDSGGEPKALEGCEHLPFDPKPVARLTTGRTTSSTGFDFTLDGNAVGLLNPRGRASSQVREARLDLANGITINPSLGAGLGTCSLATYEAIHGNSGPDCPNDSKIGELTIESPLFEGQIEGGVFLATPDNQNASGKENPFDSLIALYLVARSPERGLAVKVAGKLDPDPNTGDLTATFIDLPELPYSHFNVHFRDGQRSPLASPSACGIYSSRVDLVPRNDPAHHELFDSRFELSTGIGAGPCPSGIQPFAPTAKGGTANRNAGSYSPFYLRLQRSDAEQEITSYSAKLPRGLLGKLAGIPYCPDGAIARAAHNSGFAETQSPSCPEASKIGHTTAGYGLGSTLTYAPGNLYLAGPYGGRPFSVVAIDSATVGPFDLGVVIVRSAIDVDPRTAQVSIDSAASDPIPHIIDGIPIHLRDIRVYIDRPNFTLNPTSCDPLSLDSSLTGAGADLGTTADDPRAAASVPFQVSNCSAIGFKPKLSFRLKGQAKRGDYPSLIATYKPRSGDSNSAKVTATLANTIFLAQGHIDTVCTKPQFASHSCPAGSVYGKAEAITPLLAEPLRGPVYLRSSNTTLPEVVAQISNGPIQIELVGRITSYKGGLRATFEDLPDAPVTRFTMSLFGGKRGLLEMAANACTAAPRAGVRLVGQNNKGEIAHPRLHARCGHGKRRGRPSR